MLRGQRAHSLRTGRGWTRPSSAYRWWWFTETRLIDAEIATLAEENEWEGIVVYGSVREVDELEDMNIGIQALASNPVGATQTEVGEVDVPVNFAGVSFLPEDYIYADNTGIILSQEALETNFEIDEDE